MLFGIILDSGLSETHRLTYTCIRIRLSQVIEVFNFRRVLSIGYHKSQKSLPYAEC